MNTDKFLDWFEKMYPLFLPREYDPHTLDWMRFAALMAWGERQKEINELKKKEDPLKLLPPSKDITIGHHALEKFGEQHQTIKAEEELFELILELAKWRKNPHHPKELIIDELADVLVMVMQMSLIHGWDEVESRYIYKIMRLEKMISGEGEIPFLPTHPKH